MRAENLPYAHLRVPSVISHSNLALERGRGVLPCIGRQRRGVERSARGVVFLGNCRQLMTGSVDCGVDSGEKLVRGEVSSRVLRAVLFISTQAHR